MKKTDNVKKTDRTNKADRFKGLKKFLTLDKLPEFKPGQQLTGSLTYTTENYYAQSAGDKYNAIYVTGKLFFTCKIRERTQFDALMERKR